jgi:hypothetical protein
MPPSSPVILHLENLRVKCFLAIGNDFFLAAPGTYFWRAWKSRVPLNQTFSFAKLRPDRAVCGYLGGIHASVALSTQKAL